VGLAAFTRGAKESDGGGDHNNIAGVVQGFTSRITDHGGGKRMFFIFTLRRERGKGTNRVSGRDEKLER